MFGDRELACSANLESSCSVIFGEIVLGDFWSNLFLAILGVIVFRVFWSRRVRRIGGIVFGEHVGDRHVVAYSPMAMGETYNR